MARSTSHDPASTSPTAQSKQHLHPRKRSHSQAHAQPDHLAYLAGAVDESKVVSPRITQEDRQKVRVVVESLAPVTVLEQQLTVPTAPKTLQDALADTADLLPVSVLRACLNESCTSALLSSAMALDADADTNARLLNDVDEFQRVVGGVLDELERSYEVKEGKGRVKKEEDAEVDALAANQPPSKMRKYMLHRTLANGIDLFSSAAILSDADLEALSRVDDTDLIAVHPTSSSSLSGPPAPPLGSSNPRPLPSSTEVARTTAPAQRVGMAPGLWGKEGDEYRRVFDPLNPTRRTTTLLSYPSPFLSSLAPTHDSGSGATEPYTRSASRALSEARTRRWEEKARIAPVQVEFNEEEKRVLRVFGIERPDELLGLLEGGEGDDIWGVLERNAERIVKLGRAGVRRTRRALRVRQGAGVEKGKAVKKDDDVMDVQKEGAEEESMEATEAEKAEAQALLQSLVSLIARLPPSNSSTRPRILPPPSLLRSLAPLLVASSTKEASYDGTLEPVNDRAVRLGERAVGEMDMGV
ncbi:hypothetical protein Rt10032_c07g3071 [Rhodotorula toruloides]|uniref:Uncharacterized protein n=1 Tax=Rhodotorula toruloides TaxID=5286 RepID=A0A511KHX3_RHOTO|nr:hypothetical protein Rt10032_c07g3071 [Rhodotorula toruloides]